jgi:hypothetical protein
MVLQETLRKKSPVISKPPCITVLVFFIVKNEEWNRESADWKHEESRFDSGYGAKDYSLLQTVHTASGAHSTSFL